MGVRLKLNVNRAADRRQAGGPGGRLRGARHHQPQDQGDDPGCRRGRGPFPHRLAAHRLALLLRRRHARPRQAPGREHDRGGDARARSASTACASSRSTASTAPWARPTAATPARRNTATPASRATIPVRPVRPARAGLPDQGRRGVTPDEADDYARDGARHRRQPRPRLRRRPRPRRGGEAVIAMARTVGGLEDLADEIDAAGGPPDPGAAVDNRRGRAAAPLPRHRRALGATRSRRPLRRPRRAADAGAASRRQGLRPERRGQPQGHRATDRHAGAAPAGRGRRALRPCRRQPWGPALLRRLRATKAGAEALVRSWAAETVQLGPKVTVFNPRPMPTAVRGRFFPGEAPES